MAPILRAHPLGLRLQAFQLFCAAQSGKSSQFSRSQ
jgi:hypothetical protein